MPVIRKSFTHSKLNFNFNLDGKSRTRIMNRARDLVATPNSRIFSPKIVMDSAENLEPVSEQKT